MDVVKRGLYYFAIALSTTVMHSSAVISSLAAPNLGNGTTLEESLQDCADYEFDGRKAQKQIGNKCVWYEVSNQEEFISIYEPLTDETGYLTFIPNNDFIEKKLVEVIPSMLPGERLYKEIEDINISLDEERYLRSLFLKYKKILKQKGKQILI